MDGKSRLADNIMIERWFRSFKYEEAYLTEYANLKEAREAIGRYIYNYNFERCHQAIDNKRPAIRQCFWMKPEQPHNIKSPGDATLHSLM